MQATSIPVVITPEANDYLNQLGMRPQFDQMTDYLRSSVLGVSRLEVRVQPPYDAGGDDVVLISVQRPDVPEDEPHNLAFDRWLVTTFPPNVLEHIIVLPF